MSDFDANVEKTNDFLAHYGVPGMKWGKRKAEDSGSGGEGGGKASKPTSADIKEARKRVGERSGEIESRYRDDIAKSDAQYNKQFDSQKRMNSVNAANKKFDDAYQALSESDDNKIASRMTTGEKWAAGVGVGLYGVAAIGLAASYVGARR